MEAEIVIELRRMKSARFNILCQFGVGWDGVGVIFVIGICIICRPHMHLAKMSLILMVHCLQFL
jgi:hypothetical protein